MLSKSGFGLKVCKRLNKKVKKQSAGWTAMQKDSSWQASIYI